VTVFMSTDREGGEGSQPKFRSINGGRVVETSTTSSKSRWRRGMSSRAIILDDLSCCITKRKRSFAIEADPKRNKQDQHFSADDVNSKVNDIHT
jgi:hypothetical protein